MFSHSAPTRSALSLTHKKTHAQEFIAFFLFWVHTSVVKNETRSLLMLTPDKGKGEAGEWMPEFDVGGATILDTLVKLLLYAQREKVHKVK